MAGKDSAIEQAAKYWNKNQPKEAMQVLIKRINELNLQLQTALTQTSPQRKFYTLKGLLIGVLAVVIFFIALNFIGNLSSIAEIVGIRTVNGWWDDTEPLLDAFWDAEEIAGSTPRISLSDPIAEMQAIKREFSALDTPDKASTARIAIINAMELTIQSYLSFLGDQSGTIVESYQLESVDAWIAVESQLAFIGIHYKAAAP